MKIVVTGTRGIPDIMGGVETHCEQLFPRIVEMGHGDIDITIIRRDKYVHDDLTEWRGVKLLDIASPNKKSFEAITHTFRAICRAKKMKADILHIHAIGPALLTPLAKILGMKVVFTHHGPDYDRDKWGLMAKTMLKMGERMGCRFADEVIVISDVIRQLIAKKYNRTQHVHLIYNGVPKAEICDYDDYFDSLGIEKGKYILAMCRFVPEKRLEDLIHGFLKTRHGEDIKLVLAGDTDFEDDYSKGLKQLARDNGVVLTGFVKGKKQQSLLSNALGYCLPSSHEGLPIALLEAMNYRLPVVVSDIPANKEVGLEDNCYFHLKDIDMLAQRLQTIIDAPLRRVDYDMKKYDWDNIAKQTMETYRLIDS